MKSPLLPLQKALIERLRANLACPVYDDFPKQEAFPYVITGELRAEDWSAKAEPGQEITARVHIWSKYPGKTECLQIADQIIQALSSGPLMLEGGFQVVIGRFSTFDPILDIDGKTRHGVLEWKYKIEEVTP